MYVITCAMLAGCQLFHLNNPFTAAVAQQESCLVMLWMQLHF